MIFNFFNAIKEKDVKNMLDLFDDKCTVIEPFSIETRWDGKDNLESFFSTMCYVCDGVEYSLSFDEGDKDFESNARCEFRLGDSVTAYFRLSCFGYFIIHYPY
jgi:ketosteroid isomerase-like protein